MALIVEDGSCVTDADAFVSRVEFVQWELEHFPTVDTSDPVAVDGAIVRATAWLSSHFKWKGTPTCGRSQSLAWPRQGAVDCDGNLVPSNEVPEEVKQACFYAADAELANSGALSPIVTPSQVAKREKVDVIEVEYGVTAPGADASRAVPTAALDYIRCLTIGGSGFLKRA